MMVATYKCGCPPPSKEPCSPCCVSGQTAIVNPPDCHGCPASPCCNKQSPKPVVCLPKVEEPPPCCPTMPSNDCADFERSRKLRSEIGESGLPYSEFEAIINNNKLIIRTQEEPGKPIYDPPCDCIEDSSPRQQVATQIEQGPVSGNRTVTLYSRPKCSSGDMNERSSRNEEEELSYVRTIDQEENPNIFLLRVKKKSTDGDKKFNIDLEFKTPRPWSQKKRLEYDKMVKPVKFVERSTMMKDLRKREEKGDRSRKKRRKMRK